MNRITITLMKITYLQNGEVYINANSSTLRFY